MNAWENEPNELGWTDKKTGYECLILRMRDAGHLCGYVRLPEGHPLYGVGYSAEFPELLKSLAEVEMNSPVGKRGAINVFFMALRGSMSVGDLFDVHGSITFSGRMRNREGFWYGFDCAHAGDLQPESAKRYGFDPEGVYRDIEYVKTECTRLAAQLAQAVS